MRFSFAKRAGAGVKSLAAVCALCLAGATGLLAQPKEAPQIRFLHLRLKDQSVSLLGTVTRPGVVKSPLNSGSLGVQYELVSATGALLWKGAIADPGVRHLEYEDPPGSGNLKRKTVVLSEAEFTVRVPVLSTARRLDFYKLEPGPQAAAGQKSAVRKPLGSVPLP